MIDILVGGIWDFARHNASWNFSMNYIHQLIYA